MEQLGDVRLLIARARELAEELESIDLEYDQSDPYAVTIEPDAASGEFVHRLHVKPYPIRAKVVAADAVNNLRSSLDHLIVRSRELAGGTGRSGFPFGASRENFERAFRQMRGVPLPISEYIFELNPFSEGNERLYGITTLSGGNKHARVALVEQVIMAVSIERIDGSRESVPLRHDGRFPVYEFEFQRTKSGARDYRIQIATGIRLHGGPPSGATPANAVRHMSETVERIVNDVESMLRLGGLL